LTVFEKFGIIFEVICWKACALNLSKW